MPRTSRRQFICAFAAPVYAWAQTRPSGPLTISAVELLRCEGSVEGLAGVNAQPQIKPLDVYAELRPKPYRDDPAPKKTTRRLAYTYLRIRTNQGLDGIYGPIDSEAYPVIQNQLRPFLLGKDPLAGEALWDQLFRLNRHSRRGHFMIGISAVDNALWDLRGRYYDAPVYRLLGGPTRPSVEAYGSCLGYSLEPEAIRTRTKALKDRGFRHQKWFLAYGPGDGYEGLKKNIELVRVLREAGGEDLEIFFDAFMGWDLAYATQWTKAVEQYRPSWIEEAFHVDKIASFAALRQATSIPVATGEHFYNRWEVDQYLDANALHICQADPEWCGGVSELVRIVGLCSANDVRVIPHGHALHASLHVVASQSPGVCPLVEYLITKMETWHHFEKHPPVMTGARVTLPTRPGFGIELDAAKVEKQTVLG